MNLVLVSRLSLDELQKLAVENFSEVENKNLPANDFSEDVVFDKENTFGRILKIIPDKLIKQIALTWILPVSPVMDMGKSNGYLSQVFGHEGPNSLLSQLIKEDLATGMYASGGTRLNQAFDQFEISISLTDKGDKEYERVIELVYKFINQIREKGPLDYIYAELA